MESDGLLNTSFNLSAYLFVAAAMQGFFLAAALWFHQRNRLANRVLAVWIALLSINLLCNPIHSSNFYERFPHLSSFIVLLPATYSGFLFLYVRSLIQARALRAQDALHFLGYVIMLVIALPIVGKSPFQLNDSLFVGQAKLTTLLINGLMDSLATLYAFWCFYILRAYRKQSTTISHNLFWLQILLGINLVIWLVVWVSWLIPSVLFGACNLIIYTLVSLFIYLLGYFSLRQPTVFNGIEATIIDSGGKDSAAKDSAMKEVANKYGDARLPNELRAQIFEAIEVCMRKDEVWRQANLSLAQLADFIGLSSHQVSQVLNDHRGLSFNDYLNHFRVEAVCKLLRESTDDNLLDLALSCGFSSKSSFNLTFKKHTQQTPSDYRKTHQKK